MYRWRAGLTLVALAGALSACGSQTEDTAQDQAATEESTAAAPMAMPSAEQAAASAVPTTPGRVVTGTGVITAINVEAGTITIRHEPIPELEWPQMTMMFKTSPGLAQTVAVGEKIGFDFTPSDEGGEIMGISKL